MSSYKRFWRYRLTGGSTHPPPLSPSTRIEGPLIYGSKQTSVPHSKVDLWPCFFPPPVRLTLFVTVALICGFAALRTCMWSVFMITSPPSRADHTIFPQSPISSIRLRPRGIIPVCRRAHFVGGLCVTRLCLRVFLDGGWTSWLTHLSALY